MARSISQITWIKCFRSWANHRACVVLLLLFIYLFLINFFFGLRNTWNKFHLRGDGCLKKLFLRSLFQKIRLWGIQKNLFFEVILCSFGTRKNFKMLYLDLIRFWILHELFKIENNKQYFLFIFIKNISYKINNQKKNCFCSKHYSIVPVST